MRELEPYRLPAELLAPAKVITDPIHGDVQLTELERLLVDSPSFQRLRRVRQLGTTHLVYPGATHSRFSHSLGSLVAAQLLLDIVLEQSDGLRAQDDLFAQWEEDERNGGPRRDQRVAEAVVLTRLGALLHDLGHVPFGHSVEDELRLLQPHDENLGRFEKLWRQIDPIAREAIESGSSLEGKPLMDDLKPLIVSKLDKPEIDPGDDGADPGTAKITYPFAQDVVGNTISADLIDYLSRDHHYTGLPAALGHRFLESFYVSRRDDPQKPQRMVMRIVRGDGKRERKDTITELLKFLRYRYELSERALTHHAKLAADAMVGKLLQLYHDGLYIDVLEEAAAEDPGLADQIDGYSRDDIDMLRRRAERKLGKVAHNAIVDAARERLEDTLLEHGDDGLLESLYAMGKQRALEDGRWAGVRDLSEGLLTRRLFKPIARMADTGRAKTLWERYGKSPEERRQVEQAAAAYAGVPAGWFVVIWIPPERMRLKPALALVDDGEFTDTLLHREEGPRGDDRGSEIYAAHRALWAMDVFAHPSVRDDEKVRQAVLGALAVQLNITSWERADDPVDPIDVARQMAIDELDLKRSQSEELSDRVADFYGGPQDKTLRQTVDEMKRVWEAGDGAEVSPDDLDEPGDQQGRLT
ncbi:MAG TPA: HD domain-containing protein [Thermoleophilaceae bacterium]|nr:HD domain-containing protein [Thermoleophilaceae bacterium]